VVDCQPLEGILDAGPKWPEDFVVRGVESEIYDGSIRVTL